MHEISWIALLITVAKIITVYWVMLIGLKLVGRRSFGTLGPQEFVLLALLAKIMGDKLILDNTGFIGNIVGGAALLLTVAIVDRIPPLREWLSGKPSLLLYDGKPDEQALEKHKVGITDLERTARDYGTSSLEDFEAMTLEKDGRMTGVLKEPHKSRPISVSQMRRPI